jgi:hypothetical protein
LSRPRRSPHHRPLTRLHRHPRYNPSRRLSAFVPCMSLMTFVSYVSLTAFVPGFGCVGHRAPNVDVGLRADFSCRFWKPPCTGKVLPNFSTNSDVFLVLQSRKSLLTGFWISYWRSLCRQDKALHRLLQAVGEGSVPSSDVPILQAKLNIIFLIPPHVYLNTYQKTCHLNQKKRVYPLGTHATLSTFECESYG